MLLPGQIKMRKVAESKKSSMQLLIGTYTWALSKIRESPEDKYAGDIVKRRELPVTLDGEMLVRPATCMRNGGTDECKEGPRGQNRCGLCGRRGL